MKRFFVAFLSVCTCAFGVSEVGLLPEDRVAMEVGSTERNPFGLNLPKTEASKPKVENEEARIRAALDSLSVGGITQGRSGIKVLLGPHVMEKDRTVFPIIPNQTEKLKVISISEKTLELGFLEANGGVGMRKVVIALDLAPAVQFKLGKTSDGGKNRGFDGVITKDEPVAEQ